jgi:hypothetical protein
MAAVRDLAITIQHLTIPIRRENSFLPRLPHQTKFISSPSARNPHSVTLYTQSHHFSQSISSITLILTISTHQNVKSAVNHSPSRSTQPQLHTLTSTPHHTTSSTNHDPTSHPSPSDSNWPSLHARNEMSSPRARWQLLCWLLHGGTLRTSSNPYIGPGSHLPQWMGLPPQHGPASVRSFVHSSRGLYFWPAAGSRSLPCVTVFLSIPFHASLESDPHGYTLNHIMSVYRSYAMPLR